jgi:hypothetical protein
MNREEFLAANDRVIEPVEVLVGGKKVTMYVRSLTGAERDRWEASNVLKDKKTGTFDVKMENLRARLIEIAACHEDGSPYFQPGDVARIGQKNARTVAALYDASARISGISKEDLEDIVKNSEAVPSGSFTSDAQNVITFQSASSSEGGAA